MNKLTKGYGIGLFILVATFALYDFMQTLNIFALGFAIVYVGFSVTTVLELIDDED